MVDEEVPSWKQIVVRAAVASGAEVLGWQAGVPGVGAGTGAVVQGLIDSRQGRAEEFVDGVADLVDAHRLLEQVRADPGLQNLLWDGIQAAMSAADSGKRIYLARVVANALTDDTKMDDAQFIVAALRELEGPHVRALVRLIAADDENRKDPGNNDETLQTALSNEPPAVKAVLVRTGLVLVGSQPVSSGLYSIPRAENYSITGVNEFGRRIIRELQETETN
ncbi:MULTISPECIES: hypothetical protein [Mycobacteriaceae]|uniref:Uncharacterized protein n=1 Tax=Mycolicibacterium iranicum TaxID=912594 RepID=A0A1X1WXT3_MYCIR|nr:hypothetical protein [Mycolicibacterium iranicum]ORV91447.1 hypothetical protein AWC12_03925 [Mycolicibacterium iranicum]